jgi:RNA polymerase-binding transcription factor DksA
VAWNPSHVDRVVSSPEWRVRRLHRAFSTFPDRNEGLAAMNSFNLDGAVTLRTRLAAQLDALRLRRSAERISQLESYAGAGEVRDIADEAAAFEEIDVRGTLLNHDAAVIGALERARDRIDAGPYGYCGDCELAIDPKRLEALPTAHRCSECQGEHERRLAHASVR